MRRAVLVAGLLAGFCGLAAAEEPGPEAQATQSRPAPAGYAFDNPRLLTQQLIWGLVNGVRLLANTCRERPDGTAAGLAYADWLDREHTRIAAAARDLARHYYGRDEVPLDALTAALNLKTTLELPLADESEACGSFVEALASERYDLKHFYSLRRDAARMVRAEAVRGAVARCRPQLAAQQQQALEVAFADWQATNGAMESVARARFAGSVAETPETRQWRQEAGGGAAPGAVPCERLAESLGQPSHALDSVFGEVGQ